MTTTTATRSRSLPAVVATAATAIAAMLVLGNLLRVDAAPGDVDSTFVPIPNCRLFDTRSGPDNIGPKDTPLGPGEGGVTTQQVTGTNGNCTIPNDAVGVSMNVTIVNPTAQSNLRVFPADVPTPSASNLNWLPGQSPTPNKVDVKLSPTGAIKLYNQNGMVDVLADVNGYYSNSSLLELDAKQPFTVISEAGNAIPFPGTPETIQSVEVTAPAAGRVMLSSQQSVQILTATTSDNMKCKILRSDEGDGLFGILDRDVQFLEVQAAGTFTGTFGGSRVVDIAAGETATFNLRCAEDGPTNKLMYHRKLVATFTAAA